jgi:prepilin-type N-terminal cleavage/methylation domain-containing protein
MSKIVNRSMDPTPAPHRDRKPLQLRTPQRRGFSLVEVVMAVGIIASALLIIVALFGTLIKGQREAIEDKIVVDSLGAFNSFIESEVSFDDAFQWATGEGRLLYAQYLSDSQGESSAAGRNHRAKWMKENDTAVSQISSAEVRRWIVAVLKWDEKLNPAAAAELPADADNYRETSMIFSADFYVLSSPDQDTANRQPALTATVAVNR